MSAPENSSTSPEDYLRQHLSEIVELLNKQKLEETIVQHQTMPHQDLVETLMHKRHQVAIKQKLDGLHAADIAYILESLPVDQRLTVWSLVESELDGQVLLDVSDAVRETLISDMDTRELLSATEQLDTDEIADLAPDLPEEVMQELLQKLNDQNRQRLESLLAFPDDSVASLMDFGMVTIRADTTLGVVLRYLRQRGELPEHTDKLFVVDENNRLQGALSLKRLVTNNAEQSVGSVMAKDIAFFRLDDDAEEAARAFERYDLLSAPVVDDEHQLQGRIRIDAIGLFEDTIVKIVALASLMPIVAGIGGNTGNQTSILIVRSLALGIINPSNTARLILKEIAIGILNGLVWGAVLGVIA